MRRKPSSPRRRSRGFVLVSMLASASVLLIFLGLAIDTAYLHLVKTRMQLAADAASIGGALEYKAAGGSVQVRVSYSFSSLGPLRAGSISLQGNVRQLITQ